MNGEWPAHFPPGCPAPDEQPANGMVFHLLRHDEEANWKSALQRGVFVDGPPCQRASLSCYVDVEAARLRLGLQPGRFRAIVTAELQPTHGVMRPTPSPRNPDHYSLWLRAEHLAKCAEIFVEIPGEE